MKRKILVCLLLISVILAGCGEMVQPATEPTVTTTEPTTPATTLPTIELRAVNQLSFRQMQETPTIRVMDSRTAALVTVTVDGQSKKTALQVLDLYTDTILAERTMDGELVTMQGTCEGYLVLFQENSKKAFVLDKKLETVLEFQAPSIGGILLPDLVTYYYIWGSQLRCLNTENGQDTQVKPDPDLPITAITGYDAQKGVLLVKGAADVYSSDGCLYALSLETMECILLQVTSNQGTLATDGVCVTGEALDEYCADLVFADWDSGKIYTYPELLRNDKDFNTWHIAGSNYCFQIKYDVESNTKAADMQLFRLGEELTVCSLMEPLQKTRLKELLLLPDGNILAVSINRRGFQPYILCPDQLEFLPAMAPESTEEGLVDNRVLTLHQQAQKNQKLPEHLMAVRAQADAIGEKYGVTVLMSNQCASAISTSGMDITTTDQAGMADEAQVIEKALQQLDKALQLYPSDFFDQFRDEAGEHGLLILLVENFEGDERGVIGLCYEMYPWYTIAVDITSYEVYNTYCHEIWHATENRLNDILPGLLLPSVWDPCNPEDFAYSYNVSASYIEDVEYTFYKESNINRIYFVDPYAKTNAYEDRARLMEYVMSNGYADELMKAPAMQMKLAIMADAIRQVFDTTNWQNVYWERFF